jgi:putative nucleotidyltransferase with HDIG domain
VITTLLAVKGYECTAVANGRSALEEIARDGHDLVVSDIVMPELDGLRLLEKIHAQDPELPVVMVTAMHDLGIALQAIRAGAYDYILKPFEKEQLYVTVRRALDHRRLVLENRTYQRDLERLVSERTQQLSHALRQLEKSYDYTLEALGGALDAKDAETEGHCQRVTAITITIARAMNVDKERVRHIARGAFLHDIGKMGIPDVILRKPGPLNPQERAIMRRHCEIGYGMLERIPFLSEAAEIVLTHQECFDGTGYPRGLKGEEIPLGSRIFAVADTLDAIISDRTYRRSQPISAAREEIRAHSGTQFDPSVVEVFLAQPDSSWMDVQQSAGAHERLSQLIDL